MNIDHVRHSFGQILTRTCFVFRQAEYHAWMPESWDDPSLATDDYHRLTSPGLSGIKQKSEKLRKLSRTILSCIWRGFQAWDTLQNSIDDSIIDKVEASLERQEHFSRFQDTTDALPCHIRLPLWLWITDPHSRAAKKNTSHGRQHQGMDRPGVRQVPEGSGEQGKMEKTGCINHLWCPNDPRG